MGLKLPGIEMHEEISSTQISEMERCAHEDLTRRARGGITIYLLAWLSQTIPLGVHESHFLFFSINTVVLTIVMSLRLTHLMCWKTDTSSQVYFAKHWLVVVTLIGSLHWGLMTAWVTYHPDMDHFRFNMVATAAVLGIAGTATLSISHHLRLWFPVFMLVPMILALIARATVDDYVLATMAMLALGYVMVTAKTASNDYWNAITLKLVAEQRAQEMERLSVTDQLTGLKNRSYFDQRFVEEWKRSERQGLEVAVLMLDLDNFKALNDTYGHAFGDEVLRQAAEVFQSSLYRNSDLVARYGGEEFVILLPETNAASAEQIGERVRVAIEARPFIADGQAVQVSCSIGAATTVPNRAIQHEELLKSADSALYESKENGRNLYTAAPPIAEHPWGAKTVSG